MKDKRYKTAGKVANKTNKTKLENWHRYYLKHHAFHINRNRKYYLERMFEWYAWFEKEGYGKCSDCGFDKHPKAIDFHHRDPTTKVFGIGKFINGRQCNKENQKIVKEEIKKCDCLCANCHRILHFIQANEHTDKH